MKPIKAAVPVVLLGLALTGCGAETAQRASGRVESKQVDRECRTLSMAPVALAAPAKGRGGSGGSGGRGGSSGGGSRTGSSGGGGGWFGGGKEPLRKEKKSPRKDDGADRRGDTSPGSPSVSGPRPSSSCKNEYELFVRNSSGLHEEDVAREEYRRCDVGEKFPKCMK